MSKMDDDRSKKGQDYCLILHEAADPWSLI